MKINISGLSEGIHVYELSKSAELLGLAETITGEITAKVQLEKSSRQIHLRVAVQFQGAFPCDRCLREVHKNFSSSYDSVYVWDGLEPEQSEEFDVHVITPEMNIIDISDDVRDFASITIPLKNLCREECAGLCQNCGKNLNDAQAKECDCSVPGVDPRWEKLGDLLTKKISN